MAKRGFHGPVSGRAFGLLVSVGPLAPAVEDVGADGDDEASSEKQDSDDDQHDEDEQDNEQFGTARDAGLE